MNPLTSRIAIVRVALVRAATISLAVVSLASVLAVSRTLTAEAAAPPTRRVVTTSGTATVEVKPDSARLFFTAGTTAGSAMLARQKGDGLVRQSQTAILALRIPRIKLKTASVSVEPVMGKPGALGRPARVEGFHAAQSYTILLTDSDPTRLAASAGRVMDAALAHGASSLEQISFFKAQEAEVRRQALTAAVQDGVKNAEALVAGVGGRLTGTVTIKAEPDEGGFAQNSQMNTQAPRSRDSSSLTAGDILITGSVTITATYE